MSNQLQVYIKPRLDVFIQTRIKHNVNIESNQTIIFINY